MTTVLVRFIFNGLVALVPVAGPTTNHMDALLLDTHHLSGVPSDFAQCVAPHMAELTATIPDTSKPACVSAGCTIAQSPTGQAVCTCQFFTDTAPQAKKLWLEPDATPPPTTLNISQMPEIPKAPDFYYLLNLVRSGFTFDTNYVTATPPTPVVWMRFPFASLTACKLAVRPEDTAHDLVHSFSVRKLHELHDPAYKSQAVVQALIGKVNYQLETGGQLNLVIADSDGLTNKITLPLATSGTVDIVLSNHRNALNVDDPCDDGVGRDFALFYPLTQQKPAWPLRLLPHVRFTTVGTVTEDTECSTLPIDKVPTSRPICPMASFY